MIYRHSFTVNSHACDYNGVVRPSAVMTYLQEAANMQLLTCGQSYEDMKAAGQFFVLSRIGVVLHTPIRAYEQLHAETWAVPSRGFSFFRCHRLLRGEDVICEATSVWALLDVATRRPLRVTEYKQTFDNVETPDLVLPDRIRMSRDGLQSVGKYTVRYADTDQNQHMNNTAYPDMLCGFLDLHGKYINRFSINYFQEAPLGTRLEAFYEAGEEGQHLFRTVREDGETNVEASLSTKALA
jgi:acyl-ACP thioesterase